MQLFNYNPHPFLFIAFPNFFLLNNMLYLFFLACSCFLACLNSFYSMFPCLCHDLQLLCCWPSLFGIGYVYFSCFCLDPHDFRLLAMIMLRSTCLYVLCHFFFLDLHVSAQIYVPIFRSMCLCALCHACVLRSMLVAMPYATLALFVP